jgi:hypothetical protein
LGTHICLVSAQPIPNLIPILAAEPRPDEVVLLVSRDMSNAATWLEGALIAYNLRVSRVGIDPFDIVAGRETIRKVVEERKAAGVHEVVVNLTGGTKPMALAAFQVCGEHNLRGLYVDTQNANLLELWPSSTQSPLPNVLKVKTYLRSYGYAVEGGVPPQVPQEWRSLGEALRRDLDRWQRPLRTLNYLAHCAKDTGLRVLAEGKWSWREFAALVDLFARSGVLRLEGEAIVFADELGRLFSCGGWLEQYVASVVQGLRARLGITDLLGNVTIRSPNGTPNELDVVFTAHNRLHIIECKVRHFRDGEVTEAEPVYKLQALREEAGGHFGKAMLVSYFPLTPTTKQRCADAGIGCVDGTALEDLRSRLSKWVNSP